MSGTYEDLVEDLKAKMTALGSTHSLDGAAPTQVKEFQNLAISQINGLVTEVFGTVGVPAPIPPI